MFVVFLLVTRESPPLRAFFSQDLKLERQHKDLKKELIDHSNHSPRMLFYLMKRLSDDFVWRWLLSGGRFGPRADRSLEAAFQFLKHPFHKTTVHPFLTDALPLTDKKPHRIKVSKATKARMTFFLTFLTNQKLVLNIW